MRRERWYCVETVGLGITLTLGAMTGSGLEHTFATSLAVFLTWSAVGALDTAYLELPAPLTGDTEV
jgi:hypothetical protein